MQVFGRELTTEEIIRFVRDFAAQTRHHKDCHDCLYIDMALALADEVEKLNRRAAPENPRRKSGTESAENGSAPASVGGGNKPLTLNELRQMNGKPVWIKADHYGVYADVITLVGKEDGENWVSFAINNRLRENGYGRTWLAYSRRPEGSETNG